MEPTSSAPSRRRLILVGVAVVVTLVALFLAGLVPRLRRTAALEQEAERAASAPPRVRVTRPQRAPTDRPLHLPGTIEPLREAVIYARTSGYLRRWLVDLGAQVTAGQLLAEIDTPEIDQDYAQAQADLARARVALEQARSNRAYALITRDRAQTLTPSGVLPQQELDQREAALRSEDTNVRAAEAAIRASEAHARRLTEQRAFARVTAPFAGTITARTTEVGALVSAGSGSGQALFRLAQSQTVRVFIHVPQIYAPSLQVGQLANLVVRELPARTFPGRVAHMAGALDAASHTMLAEVQVENRDGRLLVGMFAQVDIAIPAARPLLLIDASALISNAAGTQVAVVGADGRVAMKAVLIAIDDGAQLAIAAGLGADDRVVQNPGEHIGAGVRVEVVEAPRGPGSAS